jgi:hypothetical protein
MRYLPYMILVWLVGISTTWARELSKGTDISFGELSIVESIREESVTREIVFKNRGLSTLKNLNVDFGCSCFEGYVTQKELLPGSETIIVVKLIPTKLTPGSHRYRLNLRDGENNLVGSFIVSYAFYPPLWLADASNKVQLIQDSDSRYRQRFWIHSRNRVDLETLEITSEQVFMQFTLAESIEVVEQRLYRRLVVAEFNHPVNAGNQSAMVDFVTKSSNFKLSAVVSASVVKLVRIQPMIILFAESEVQKPRKATIRSQIPIRCRFVEPLPNGFKAEFVEQSETTIAVNLLPLREFFEEYSKDVVLRIEVSAKTGEWSEEIELPIGILK